MSSCSCFTTATSTSAARPDVCCPAGTEVVGAPTPPLPACTPMAAAPKSLPTLEVVAVAWSAPGSCVVASPTIVCPPTSTALPMAPIVITIHAQKPGRLSGPAVVVKLWTAAGSTAAAPLASAAGAAATPPSRSRSCWAAASDPPEPGRADVRSTTGVCVVLSAGPLVAVTWRRLSAPGAVLASVKPARRPAPKAVVEPSPAPGSSVTVPPSTAPPATNSTSAAGAGESARIAMPLPRVSSCC
mmetsp:Transcript_25750/g.74071  ORF Transcript_25750/g.74071 Transcript_25750/m.74071 type:complete len:243 (-) Transcript_25750:59-787(-)